jgi:hypothetical protein
VSARTHAFASARRRAFAALVISLALVTSCSGRGGLLFSQDRRIDIREPDNNDKVTMPLTISWTLDDGVEIGRDIAAFALFFDAEPQAPRKKLDVLARGDLDCERTPGCPDAAYFAERDIFVTKQTSFTIEDLLPLAGVEVEKGERDVHDVTIVVLDEQGRRVNEAFWSRTFEIVHPEVDG